MGGLVGRLLGGSASGQLEVLEPDGPGHLSGARVDPGRRGVLAMVMVTVLTVLVAGGWVLASRPHPMLAADSAGPPAATSVAPRGSAAPRASSAAPSVPAGPLLVVDVAGKVRRPGVYRLPPGARVDDAVRAAGGLLAGVDPVSVNLARKLADGEQVLIGLAASAAVGAPSGSAPAGPGAASTGSLDLNTATVAQLDALPGVGPVLAQHILDWRTEHGRFDSVDQLNSVTGIGDSKFADLKSLVTVG